VLVTSHVAVTNGIPLVDVDVDVNGAVDDVSHHHDVNIRKLQAATNYTKAHRQAIDANTHGQTNHANSHRQAIDASSHICTDACSYFRSDGQANFGLADSIANVSVCVQP